MSHEQLKNLNSDEQDPIIDFYPKEFGYQMQILERKNLSNPVSSDHLRLTEKVNFHFVRGDYVNAAGTLRELLRNEELSYGWNHPILCVTLNNIAVVYNKQGEGEEVKELAKRVLNIYDQPSSHYHLDFANKLYELSQYFGRQEMYDEEQRCYNRALQICLANLSLDHYAIFCALGKVNTCSIVRRKYEDAEMIFKQVLSVAYEREFGTNVDSRLPEQYTVTSGGAFGRANDDKRVTNIWQVAEERERNRSIRPAEEIWYKPANFDEPYFGLALGCLSNVYRMQGKHVAAETLKRFSKQQRTDTMHQIVKEPPKLYERNGEKYWNIPTRILMNPSAPPLIQTEASDSFTIPFTNHHSETIPRMPLSPPTWAAPQETPYQANRQFGIILKSQQEANPYPPKQSIETHGAFCSICRTKPANRIWSTCYHLAACSECTENLLRTEQNRNQNGIPCPKCQTHGRPMPVFN